MTNMLIEYLSQVAVKMVTHEPPIKFGLINAETSRIIEARF